jgi:hypothetical protein
MTEYVPYITQTRDRWDLISERFYGTPFEFERIITANPVVPIVAVIPAGLRLAIPIIDRAGPTLTEQLPPWKRGGQ